MTHGTAQPQCDTENRTPGWVWGVIVVLALQQPLVFVLLRYAMPPGHVATGLPIADSALFLQSMRMFETGFTSPYATCLAGSGGGSLAYYSVPHLWLYGVIGLVARLLHADPLAFYMGCNGLGACLYLYAVYRFLRAAVPALAAPAFVLFALSAGPGGLLYGLTGLLGLHAHPGFETYFFRFAVYELIEGPLLQPVLYFPRFYYTLSLACCFAALTALVRARATGRRSFAHWLLLPGAFIDARYGLFTVGLSALYLAVSAPENNRGARVRLWLYMAAPALFGMACASALMRLNPAVIGNHLQVGSMAMWISPFVAVAWLHLLLAVAPLRESLRRLAPVPRAVACACLGYLIAQAVLYVLYQGYYGNLLTGRDGSVAAAISDVALLGAAAGVVWAWRTQTPVTARVQPADWLVLWFLLFLSASISGVGQGWFLQFGPQRLQVFLWLPLCVLAAMGLAWIRPRFRAAAWAVLLGCGILSIAVATLCFQGPYASTYPGYHTETMTQNDALLLNAIGNGTVVAPAPASDMVALQHGKPVLFGVGTFNLTTLPYARVKAVNDRFFAAATPDEERRQIAREWCCEWVYCPDRWPVDPASRQAFRQATWLETVAEAGQGLVLRVRPAP